MNRESEVWEVVNRERKQRKKINEGMEGEEWKENFMRLLGGVDGRVVKGSKSMGQRDGREDSEEEIERGELREILGKMRDGEASGIDGIPAEVWKYGGEELE